MSDFAPNTYNHPDDEGEHTGGSVEYYKVLIRRPVTAAQPYVAECLDVMIALDLNVEEQNMFKAIWRTAAERTLGKKKAGNDAKYDAQKIHFFSGVNLRRYDDEGVP